MKLPFGYEIDLKQAAVFTVMFVVIVGGMELYKAWIQS